MSEILDPWSKDQDGKDLPSSVACFSAERLLDAIRLEATDRFYACNGLKRCQANILGILTFPMGLH